MTKLEELEALGQSAWLDYIRRSFLTSNGLYELINQGVRGITANPTILAKAITAGDDYDAQIRQLVQEGRTADEIYLVLVSSDLQRAADLLHPYYLSSMGEDGFVSLEVRPALAYNTASTMIEVRRLFEALNRPNILIKVPATPEGIPAIRELTTEGYSINITLIFSIEQYKAVVEAYLAGLEARLTAGGDISHIASVASFFVSRIDTVVDNKLEAIGAVDLQGKMAIANARVAYDHFRQAFSGPRWSRLAARGARIQRPLWASTSTKDPRYPDTMYVDALIAPHTVNTMPLETLQAFLDHGHVAYTLEAGIGEAYEQLQQLSALGIDLHAITDQLLADGVTLFAKSFEQLMSSIAEKRQRLLGKREAA